MPYFKSNHRKLFYREQGQGPLLLILPGSTASSACHQGELNYFSAHFHAVSLDFCGTGKSDKSQHWPEDWWTRGAHDAAALVEHLGEETCVVMGTSGGGVVALLMAQLYPQRVQAVVADSCTSRFPPEEIPAVVSARENPQPEQIAFWEFAHGSDWEQVVKADSSLLLRFAERGGQWLNGQLSTIQCPVLFTASLGDELLFNVGEEVLGMSQQIKCGHVFMTREGTHPLMWSCPEDFRCACDAFLDWVISGEEQPVIC